MGAFISSSDSHSSVGHFDAISRGGETGAIIRARDWSQSSLGPIESWPQSLTTALSICLLSKQPMFVWWKTGERLVIFYNDAYIPIAADKHPEQIGSDPRDPKGFPEMWPYLKPLVDQVFIEGTATWNENLYLPIYRKADFMEEAYWSFSYSPVTGELGQVAGMYCSTIETTKQVLNERRMRLLRNLATGSAFSETSEVFEHATLQLATNKEDVPFALVYHLDADGKTARLVSSAHLDLETVVTPKTIDLNDATSIWPLGSALQSSEIFRAQGLRAKYPNLLPVAPWDEAPDEALILPIESPSQDLPTGFAVIGLSARLRFDQDYQNFLKPIVAQIATNFNNARTVETQRKRAEELAEIDRAKTAFFSNVSHEFRTPLTLMLGPLEDNLADLTAPTAHLDRDRLAHRNALRLLKLVNSLLDFSRIEAGRIQAVYEQVDLGVLTADLASAFRSAMEKAGLKYSVDTQKLSHPVFVDREMWEKIVLNLISNAFKFTFKGEIKVSLDQTENFTELSIQDTGTGIPESELPHLFERFHRIEGAEGRTHEGTGIGLALIQELAKLHGGAIEVQSQFGSGSRFSVKIPNGSAHLPEERLNKKREMVSTSIRSAAFVEEALRWLPDQENLTDASATSEANLPQSFKNFEKARILLADDNADMRGYVKSILSAFCQVDAVADGKQALDSAIANPPDLILSDVMMPQMDGFALLKELRANPKTESIPVVLLSARAGEEATIEGFNAGADDYLVKPFSAKELLARVQTHLQGGRLKAELKTAVAESRLANEAKSAFLAHMSHEIRTPLGAIMGFSEMARQPGATREDIASHLGVVERNSKQVLRIIDDILDLAKVEAGRVELEDIEISLTEFLADFTSLVSFRARENGILFHIEATSDLPSTISTDPTRLRQILTNAVGNAIKFTHKGSVTLSVSFENDCLSFKIKDTGRGISEEQSKNLFQAFVQADASTTRKFGGTGLGLVLTKRLCQLLGGDYVLNRSQLDQGSEFEATVKVNRPTDSKSIEQNNVAFQSVVAPEIKPQGQRLDDISMLLVEDSHDNQVLLKLILERQGAKLDIASDGRTGVSMALAGKYDIVLMDIQMPEMDGHEAARSLRSKGFAKPIVALTAHAMKEEAERAQKSGFTNFLSKPIQREALVSMVRKLTQ